MISTPKGLIPDFMELPITITTNNQNCNKRFLSIVSGYFFIIECTLDASMGNNLVGYYYDENDNDIVLTDISGTGTVHQLFSDIALNENSAGTLEIWNFNNSDYRLLTSINIVAQDQTIYG